MFESGTGLVKRHKPAFVHRHKQRQSPPPAPEKPKPQPIGRLPRITKLMALAIRFESLLADGVVRDQAEIAELGHVTRARVTQIMNLLHLAPDIQEEILFLPPVAEGKDPIPERRLRAMQAEINWPKQRRMWERLIHGKSTP